MNQNSCSTYLQFWDDVGEEMANYGKGMHNLRGNLMKRLPPVKSTGHHRMKRVLSNVGQGKVLDAT